MDESEVDILFLLLCCTFFCRFFFSILKYIFSSFGTDNDWRLLVMNLVFVYIAFGRWCVQVVAVRNSFYLLALSLAQFSRDWTLNRYVALNIQVYGRVRNFAAMAN